MNKSHEAANQLRNEYSISKLNKVFKDQIVANGTNAIKTKTINKIQTITKISRIIIFL